MNAERMTAGILSSGPPTTTMPGETVQHFTRWSRELQDALELIEETAFAAELRYTRDEMIQRAGKPGFEGLLLTDIRGSAAILFIYYRESNLGGTPGSTHFIYLDTLAVRDRGHGTGTRLLRFLIERCRRAGISGIELDTEAANAETSQDLPAYYRRFGFEQVPKTAGITTDAVVIDAAETATMPVPVPGNITMRIVFTKPPDSGTTDDAG